jgi:hypothetical protein
MTRVHGAVRHTLPLVSDVGERRIAVCVASTTRLLRIVGGYMRLLEADDKACD